MVSGNRVDHANVRSDCIRRDLSDEGYEPKAWTWYLDFGPSEPPSGSVVVWNYLNDATNHNRSFW